MPIDPPTDADDFGLGYGDPRSGEGVDYAFLEAKPGYDVGPASVLPQGTDPETYRRTGPGETRRVTDPGGARKTPAWHPYDDTAMSSTTLPGDGAREEWDQHYNLGPADMVTVEDVSSPKKGQPSDTWICDPDAEEPDSDICTSSRIRRLACSVRGR